MQAYNLAKADQFVAITGHQNISFSYSLPVLQQRIDREFIPAGKLFPTKSSPLSLIRADYWIWGSPTLSPIDYSLVVKEGPTGFACYVRGNNVIFLPPDLTQGYTDGMASRCLSNLKTSRS